MSQSYVCMKILFPFPQRASACKTGETHQVCRLCGVLCQHQFSSFDNIHNYVSCLHWGKLGDGDMGTSLYYFLQQLLIKVEEEDTYTVLSYWWRSKSLITLLATGIHTPCWQESKVIYLYLRGEQWGDIYQSHICYQIPLYLALSLLRIHATGNLLHTHTTTYMEVVFTAALLQRAKDQKQPKCPPKGDWSMIHPYNTTLNLYK